MTPAVIDTDPGIDDALALLLAWNSPELRVDALTTVAGNVPVDLASTNALRLLALRRPSPTPLVAGGASSPLARPLTTATRYHGEDGLGDLADWPAVASLPTSPDAATVIVDAARRHGRELTLIALGPLTNVALALKADAASVGRIGRVVVMGGAVDVPGNVTPAAEFNMHVDPEAAHRVLAAGLPLELVPLDATRQAVLPRAGLRAALARSPGVIASRIQAFSERAFRIGHADGEQGMALHDPLAVGVAFDPSLVKWEAIRLAIGPDGETMRVSGAPNCRVAKGVDSDRFLRLFLDRLCPPTSRRPASS
ncbi:MAG: nucleoside hydrolase [Candidatus Rokuibacteriota bacterium]|nr:MAG: nucleoside hydrolase [Candidatus Rokubacteria bacterium]